MVSKKIQIVLIHGGMTFRNRTDYLKYLKTRKISIKKRNHWDGAWLDRMLGPTFDAKYEMIRPRMPLKDNARYEDWKIHFERHFPFLRDNVILIGGSLGGIFLAKYLSENRFPRRILSTYLVCPPFDDTLPGEDLVGGFKLGKDLSRLQKSSKNLYLLFSKNDDVVPVSHAEKFRKKLPQGKIVVYPHIKGHFDVESFPEIVKMIKADVRKLG